MYIAWLSGAAVARQCNPTLRTNPLLSLMVGVHRVVIGRRPPPPTGAQDKIGFGWAEKTGTLEAKTGTQNSDFWSRVDKVPTIGAQVPQFWSIKLVYV